FELDDAALWDMARAFPELRKLFLAYTAVWCTPGITLGGLRAFATHCPQLGNMQIAFNATVTLPATDSATPDVFQTKLSYLDVLNSPISMPLDVARFLSGIFPNLVEVICHRQDTEDCLNWGQVIELLPKFADVRQEERLRA
ncbi:hypothetical protein C8J57DRAFT_983408, partial [Mycena rebaudengoi]